MVYSQKLIYLLINVRYIEGASDLSLVRPHLEYSCKVWSPNTKEI